MPVKRIAAAIATLGLVTACATGGGVYQPSEGSGYGFSDQRIETGRYRVTYTDSDARIAELFALRRAAELTRQEGASWFEVTDSYGDEDRNASRSGTSVGVGVSGGSGGGVSTGVGIGIGLPLSGSGKVTWTLGIVTGQGPKPAKPNAYDAEQVLMNTAGAGN
jgi:hypothetical protein